MSVPRGFCITWTDTGAGRTPDGLRNEDAPVLPVIPPLPAATAAAALEFRHPPALAQAPGLST